MVVLSFTCIELCAPIFNKHPSSLGPIRSINSPPPSPFNPRSGSDEQEADLQQNQHHRRRHKTGLRTPNPTPDYAPHPNLDHTSDRSHTHNLHDQSNPLTHALSSTKAVVSLSRDQSKPPHGPHLPHASESKPPGNHNLKAGGKPTLGGSHQKSSTDDTLEVIDTADMHVVQARPAGRIGTKILDHCPRCPPGQSRSTIHVLAMCL